MLEIILFLYGIGKQLAVEWDVLKGLTEPTDASSSQHSYRIGEHWCNLRPDALAGYRIGSQEVCFWLEWDRGTMNARPGGQVRFLAQYLASREWAREFARMPLLLCVVPEIAQERRVHRIARTALTHFPGMLMLWTTTGSLLREYGPLAPIWLPGLAHQTEARRPARELRQSVFAVPLEQRGKG